MSEARSACLLATGALAFASVLSGCDSPEPPPENHPQWVIQSKLSFMEADYTTPRAPLPQSAFRLTFPYVAGDLYGAPSIADFIHPVLNPDYSFQIDLNRTQSDLVRSLQPTEFNEQFLKIDPPEARIARLTPQALQADGIEQVATLDWVDTHSHQPLMLVYFDRPARITGAHVSGGHTTRYNVRASTAGYVWIGRVQNDENEHMYREVDRPAHVILASIPRTDDSRRSPPPELLESPKDAAEASASSSSSTVPDLRGADSPRRAAARERGVPER